MVRLAAPKKDPVYDHLTSLLPTRPSALDVGGSNEREYGVMERLSDCLQSVHLRWLASSFSCCFPRLPDQSEPDIPGVYGEQSLPMGSLSLILTSKSS